MPTRLMVEAMKGADFVLDISTGGMLYSNEQNDILAAGTRILRVREPDDCLIRLLPNEEVRARTIRGGERLSPGEADSDHVGGRHRSDDEQGRSAGVDPIRNGRQARPLGSLADRPDHQHGGGGDGRGHARRRLCQHPVPVRALRHRADHHRFRQGRGGLDRGRPRSRSCCAICLPPRTTRIAGASRMSAGEPIIAPAGTCSLRAARMAAAAPRLRSIYGGVLLALGENRDLGGLNGAPLHLDIALRRARLELDGRSRRRERTDPRSAARLNADDRCQRRASRRRAVPSRRGTLRRRPDTAVHGRGFDRAQSASPRPHREHRRSWCAWRGPTCVAVVTAADLPPDLPPIPCRIPTPRRHGAVPAARAGPRCRALRRRADRGRGGVEPRRRPRTPPRISPSIGSRSRWWRVSRRR